MKEISCYANTEGKKCCFCDSEYVEVDEILVSILPQSKKISVRIFFYCENCKSQFFQGIEED